MAIKKKGMIFKNRNTPDLFELNRELRTLPDGEYAFYICDKSKNKTLPRLKYLYGVVLKTISEQCDDHPPVDVLYRKFEKMFAPSREVKLFNSKFVYQDLKNASADELDEVIQKIIWFASENLGIDNIDRLSLRDPSYTEPYVDAYNDQWKDYNRNI
jgi:hypothetical protein